MSVIIPVVTIVIGLLLSLVLALLGALLFVRCKSDSLKLRQYKHELKIAHDELNQIQSKQEMLHAMDDLYDDVF